MICQKAEDDSFFYAQTRTGGIGKGDGKMSAVTGKQISFLYDSSEKGVRAALKDLSLEIDRGQFAVILGANGCGKSTLVKHLNGILPLQKGELSVLGLDVADEGHIRELRRRCGMVFQNPDNQFVSTIVEEDVAFGLRNYDVPEREIPDRVRGALSLVGMDGFERRSPHTLSGGQRQRVAMAGVLAMEPEVIVLDEATSMLDPQGRREVLSYLERLHSLGRTIIMITHYVEEALRADRVFLMGEGRILRSGSPRQVLTDSALLERAGLVPPLAVQIYQGLSESGLRLPFCPLTGEELVEAVVSCGKEGERR